MERREAVKRISSGLLTIGFPFIRCTSSPSGLPNVLIVLADDWSWPHAGIFGDKTVSTPWFDRIAEEGVNFTRSFVSSPSSAPSRASLLTGKYHWELEQAANMWGTFPKKYSSYPSVFNKSGYHTGFWGKGWSPGAIGVHGRYRNPAGKRFRGFSEFLRKRRRNAPFCFWYGSRYPHRVYKQGSGVKAGLDPGTVEVPPRLPDAEAVRLDMCDYYREVQEFDSELGYLYQRLERSGELENTIIVVTSDNGMPFPGCKANLYDLGTRVPMCIRWGGIKNPGREFDGFVSLVDIAPTLYEAAGIEPGLHVSGSSLMPVLKSEYRDKDDYKGGFTMEVTGRERHIAAQEENMYGYPMRALRTEKYLYIRNFKPERWPAGSPPEYRDVDRSPTKRYILNHRDDPEVKPKFDLIFGKRPPEELYDLEKDPGQINNVADKEGYKEIRESLKKKLSERLEETDDPRLKGNGDVFDDYRYYMLKRIYQ